MLNFFCIDKEISMLPYFKAYHKVTVVQCVMSLSIQDGWLLRFHCMGRHQYRSMVVVCSLLTFTYVAVYEAR